MNQITTADVAESLQFALTYRPTPEQRQRDERMDALYGILVDNGYEPNQETYDMLRTVILNMETMGAADPALFAETEHDRAVRVLATVGIL